MSIRYGFNYHTVAEKTCDSSIELIDKWPNTYDWEIEL